ncbi:MAG: hypothetical protein P4L87_03150 [Formivibrio sp.]|nr:hypothetical protein [Formivibrio sp.]
MRTPRNVFVVGAGASKEAGLPSGAELIDLIREKLGFRQRADGQLIPESGDADILDIFQQRESTSEGFNNYLTAAARIRDGLLYSKSIDSFLDLHRDDPYIQLAGKLAIGKVILAEEQESRLFVNRDSSKFDESREFRSSWYFELAKNLVDGVKKAEIERIFSNIAFVVFNYDRCLEHFLFNALQMTYGIDKGRAAEVLSTLNIVHPYGTIGDLEWRDPAKGVPFGHPANRAIMEQLSGRIRTYNEQVADRTILEDVKRLVASADTIVFLGFSYHSENMQLLSPSVPGALERVFGTAKGISGPDIVVVQEQIRKLAAGKPLHPTGRPRDAEQVYLSDCSCGQFLRDFSRSLFVSGR